MKTRFFYAHKLLNAGKHDELERLAAAYQAYAKDVVAYMLSVRDFNKMLKCGNIPTEIPHRFKNQCLFQISGILTSWWVKSYNDYMKRHITKSLKDGVIDESQAHILYSIGKYKVLKSSEKYPQDLVDRYWQWVQDPAVNRHRPSSTPNVPVMFYVGSWSIVPAEKLKDSQVPKAQRSRKFQWWVKVQGFTPYKQTYIPLSGYNPLIKHDLAKTLCLRRHNGRWQFTVFEQTPDPGFQTHVDIAPEGAEVIGVDVGLNALASLSNGKQYQVDFKSRFDRDRETILKLRTNRQKQGLSGNSPRLQRLENKLTHKVKVVTGAIANAMVAEHPSVTFALENLDLRGCRGQKRFAYRAVAKRLMQKANVVVVNPAYTSQECSHCSHTEAGNRNGEVFHCRKCGLQTNADTNAAINIMRRSHDRRITAKMKSWQVAAVLGVVRAPKGALTAPTPSGIGPPLPLAPCPQGRDGSG